MRDSSRDTPTEATIRELIADGKYDEAFELIHLAYGGVTKRRCINGLLGYVSDNIADGEELAQDILCELSHKLRTKYDPRRSTVRTYLYIITTNRLNDRRRAANRSINNHNTVQRELKLRPLIGSHSRNPEMVVLEIAVEKERKERLARAVEKLSAPDREIWKLFYEHNLSASDIADLKGTTAGAIRTRLSRINDKLVERIKHEIRINITTGYFQINSKVRLINRNGGYLPKLGGHDGHHCWIGISEPKRYILYGHKTAFGHFLARLKSTFSFTIFRYYRWIAWSLCKYTKTLLKRK
jgi:RNA polymerase sigma-70 factor (ECF subfamily)